MIRKVLRWLAKSDIAGQGRIHQSAVRPRGMDGMASLAPLLTQKFAFATDPIYEFAALLAPIR